MWNLPPKVEFATQVVADAPALTHALWSRQVTSFSNPFLPISCTLCVRMRMAASWHFQFPASICKVQLAPTLRLRAAELAIPPAACPALPATLPSQSATLAGMLLPISVATVLLLIVHRAASACRLSPPALPHLALSTLPPPVCEQQSFAGLVA